MDENWKEFAAQQVRNVEYYQGLLDEIAKNFGNESYTSDDGSIQDSPLRAKMPELVSKLKDSLSEKEKEIEELQSNLLAAIGTLNDFSKLHGEAMVRIKDLEQGR